MAKTNKFRKKPTPAATGKQRSFPVAAKKHVVKHKSKKASSLFGPISTQQPKGMKWNLTASMGGGGSKTTTAKKNSKKKARSTKRPIKGGEKLDQIQKPKPWTLNMPVVSSSDQVVPWLLPCRRKLSPSKQQHPSNKMRKIHTGLSLPVASLENLNAELQRFSEYVRLNEAEITSRLSVVELIQNHCRQIFGVSAESCKVFGSFACLPVCIFISDVDMAIHDVVQTPRLISEQTVIEVHDSDSEEERKDDDDNDNDDNLATPKPSNKRMKTETPASHPSLKRQERILAWKKALDAAEEDKKQQLGGTREHEVKEVTNKLAPVNSPAKEVIQHSSDSTSNSTPVHLYAPLRVELTVSKPLPATAVPDDNGFPLFVIDREGCPDPNTMRSCTKLSDTDTPTVTDSSKESSIPSDDDEKKDEDVVVTINAHTGTHLDSVNSSIRDIKCLKDSDDEEKQTEPHDDNSDEDSADVLAVLKTRPMQNPSVAAIVPYSVRASLNQVINIESDDDDDDDDESEQEEELILTETRPRSRSIISLCSATTCSDTEEKEWDDSGMEVSFVSSSLSAQKLTMPPSLDDETRGKVIRALNSLSRRLRANTLTNNIHVRKKAKVPIINMVTRFGYECDIAIGGHNGTDTSSFASCQCRKYQSFATVVLLLKVLLYQHGLDKPFTGGIGSFKLYVMVASHLEKHLELGGEDDPAEILITFLFRYGGIPGTSRSGVDAMFQSPLKGDTVVTTQGTGPEKAMAEMGSVFQIDNCIRVFQACYFILRRKLQKPSTDPSHSILGYIIDSNSLREERQDCQKKIPSSPRKDPSTTKPIFPPGLPFNWRGNERPRPVESLQHKGEKTAAWRHGTKETPYRQRNTERGQNRVKGSPEYPTGKTEADTDDEAEQLMAGYGIGSSARTAPKSKKRGRGKNKKVVKCETISV